MKRRDFLTKGTAAAGLVSSAKLLPPLMADQGAPAPVATTARPAQQEIRSAEYLKRAREDKFLPKPPAFSSGPADVPVSPMPLAERLKRKIVPQRGFCSTTPGTSSSEGLTSGNGAMNIEVPCAPYSEQILFRHESLMMPYKRPYADYSEDKVEALRAAVEGLTPDYPVLLERHRNVQSEALNRVAVDFGGASQRKQDVTLIARHGIASIAAPAGILAAPLQAGKANADVHLPEGKPVTFHLKLGHHNPIDWVSQVSVA